jgi:ElaB/YqjD/DUF883 family membrane-anchored ribosome-binding protein
MPTRTDTEQAATKLHTATEQITSKAHEAVDRIAEQVERAEERIRTACGSAEEMLKESREKVRLQSDRMTGTVTEYVQQHPLAALGIAFGAGVVVAALLKRS